MYKTLYVKTTNSCNLKCAHCFNSTNKDHNLNYVKLDNFIKTMPQGISIKLHGGEPLLKNTGDILKLIDNNKERYWEITTNLIYEMTEERIEILKRINAINVSFDVKIRFGTLKNLLIWIRNIKHLKTVNPNITITFCLTKHIIKRRPIKIFNMLSKLNIFSVRYEILQEIGTAKDNISIFPNPEETANWIEEYLRCSKIFPNIKIETIKMLSKPNRFHDCSQNYLCVNSNNEISICPANIKHTVIGTTKNTFKEIIHLLPDKYCKVKSECIACKFFNVCNKGCIYQNKKDCTLKKILERSF